MEIDYRVKHRLDEHGRKVGLVWPTPPPELNPKPKKPYVDRTGMGGRPQQEYCAKGLHLLSEHGRPVMKNGKQEGRYCLPCRLKRQRDYQKQYRERKKRERSRNMEGASNA